MAPCGKLLWMASQPDAPGALFALRRFPAFDVLPDAPVVPASRVQRVIDEEGIF